MTENFSASTVVERALRVEACVSRHGVERVDLLITCWRSVIILLNNHFAKATEKQMKTGLVLAKYAYQFDQFFIYVCCK